MKKYLCNDIAVYDGIHMFSDNIAFFYVYINDYFSLEVLNKVMKLELFSFCFLNKIKFL